MSDQAEKLRSLVFAVSKETAVDTPAIIAVVGGAKGAGTTSVALGLSIRLIRQGLQTLLVDADSNRPAIGLRTGTECQSTIADVYSQKQTLSEAVVQGPAGLKVLLGEKVKTVSELESQSLLQGLVQSGSLANVVLVDCGCAENEATLRVLSQAKFVVVVTTPESKSVLDSYALIKQTTSNTKNTNIAVVVNRVESHGQGEQVLERLAESCRKFLRFEIKLGPAVAEESESLESRISGRNSGTFRKEASLFGNPLAAVAEEALQLSETAVRNSQKLAG